MGRESTQNRTGHQRPDLSKNALSQSSAPLPATSISISQDIASQIDAVLGLVPGLFCVSKVYHPTHKVARIDVVVLDSTPRDALSEAVNHLALTQKWSIDLAPVTVSPGLVEGVTTLLWNKLLGAGEIRSVATTPEGIEIKTRNPWHLLPGMEQQILREEVAKSLGAPSVIFSLTETSEPILITAPRQRVPGEAPHQNRLGTPPETKRMIRSIQKALPKEAQVFLSPSAPNTLVLEFTGSADQSEKFAAALTIAQSQSPLPISPIWRLGVQEITHLIENTISREETWAARYNPQERILSVLTSQGSRLTLDQIQLLEKKLGVPVVNIDHDASFLSPSSLSTLIFPSSYGDGKRFPGSQQLIRGLRQSIREVSEGARVRVSERGICIGVVGPLPPQETLSAIRSEVAKLTSLPVSVESARDTSSLISRISKEAPPGIRVLRVSFRGTHVAIIRAQVEKGKEQLAYEWRDRLEKELHVGLFLELRMGSSGLTKRLRSLADTQGMIVNPTVLTRVIPFVPYRTRDEPLDLSRSLDGRVDLRRVKGIVNLDEIHVPDIDQAYSIHRMHGRVALAVHIPDLTHFAPPESAPYAHARARGSAVYGKDHMVPLYPPEISLGMASLIPGEDRLAFTFMVVPNKDGSIAEFKLFPSIIRNSHHLTAAQFQSVIQGEEHPLQRSFKAMARFAHALHQRRTLRSSMDFEEGGERGEVVQEFSLLVNRLFPKHDALRGVPIAHRVHDAQTPRATAKILRSIRELGIPATITDFNDPTRWRDILHQAHEKLPKQEFYHLLHASFGSARYALRGSHHALGFSRYAPVSAPCRRLLDGVNWYQFAQAYWRKPTLPARKIQAIIEQVNRQEQILDDKFSELLYIESIYATLSSPDRIYNGKLSRSTSNETIVVLPEFRSPGILLPAQIGRDSSETVEVRVVGYDPHQDRFIFCHA